MRILVTGGAGYIGAITARHLLDAGHEVVVLDSLERGRREAIDSRATFVHSAVGDTSALDAILPDCDGVMHLAGLIEVAESQREPGAYFDANVAQPVRMLDAMVRHGVCDIVFSSTAATYGEPDEVPIVEDAPTRPINVYGASKLMFEQMLDAYGAAHGIRSVRFRYFNVAGAWPDGSLGEAHDPETHIVPRILQAMASGQREFEVYGDDYPTPDGTCVRDYIHVEDLIAAHIRAMETLDPRDPAKRQRVYNLGIGRGHSVKQIVEAVRRVTGHAIPTETGPRRPGDPPQLYADSARAQRELGWQPRYTDIERIVETAWRWFKTHPEGYIEP